MLRSPLSRGWLSDKPSCPASELPCDTLISRLSPLNQDMLLTRRTLIIRFEQTSSLSRVDWDSDCGCLQSQGIRAHPSSGTEIRVADLPANRKRSLRAARLDDQGKINNIRSPDQGRLRSPLLLCAVLATYELCSACLCVVGALFRHSQSHSRVHPKGAGGQPAARRSESATDPDSAPQARSRLTGGILDKVVPRFPPLALPNRRRVPRVPIWRFRETDAVRQQRNRIVDVGTNTRYTQRPQEGESTVEEQ